MVSSSVSEVIVCIISSKICSYNNIFTKQKIGNRCCNERFSYCRGFFLFNRSNRGFDFSSSSCFLFRMSSSSPTLRASQSLEVKSVYVKFSGIFLPDFLFAIFSASTFYTGLMIIWMNCCLRLRTAFSYQAISTIL